MRRLAAFHAALAVESALNNGWETLDRYGVDRPRVEAALNELVEELQRRGRPDARPRSPRSGAPSTGPGRDVTPARDEKTRDEEARDEEARDAAGTGRPAGAVPAAAAAHLAPSKQEAGQVPEDGPAEAAVTWWPSTLGKVDFSELRRPPRGLLSAWLWQWLVAAYLRGDAGMRDRHYQAWHWLETMRERQGKEPLVSHRPPGGGPTVPDRVWITEAGRAHLEEHDARYRRLWDLRVPALQAPGDTAPANTAPANTVTTTTATTTATAASERRDENSDRDENRDRAPVSSPVPAAGAAVPQGVERAEGAVNAEDMAGLAVVGEVVLTHLTHDVHLVVADGRRVGWINRPDDWAGDQTGDRAGDGWQVHDAAGRVVATTTDLDLWAVVRAAAAALGVTTGPDTTYDVGELRDHRGRALEVAPATLARWSLMRGRVPGRTDVLVRGRCVGWLQRDRSRHVACTLDGPVPGSARRREEAVMALFAALWAPAPLPELPPEALTARRVQARPKNDKPLCPYTEGQLAAAVADPPRCEGGGYLVVVRDRWDPERRDELGVVLKTKGRRMVWTAYNTKDRPVAGGKTRTQAISQMLAVPGPLFGDPAETVVHELAGDPAGASDGVTKPSAVTKAGDDVDDRLGACQARARHEWMEFACTRPTGHPGAHRATTPTRHQTPVCWSDGGPVTDLQHRPLLRGTTQPAPPGPRRRPEPGPWPTPLPPL
ncbi:hypothetical protein ACFQU9_48270 [Actinomadura namibiensis]|uniref:Uncharacterized protein n=1 Tax=Actinomadura namibiensis TaxID=182080 RepID=A0A7W3M0U1_ACTNM|nr:hypothetical protein [Actinomadura namibiensis]MBA8957720.1 hypothetical protein [Actinomadura namibiensis]